MKSLYQQCSRCVMDTTGDEKIHFNDEGICNYCQEYEKLQEIFVLSGKEGEEMLANKIKEIKNGAKDKKYDSILGLSGGVDSSYLAHIAHREGLKPFCIHFDNGWNSEMAVKNIENIVTKLGFDLNTYVIDWNEFRDLQRAYFKASVIDIEALTDHAIFASIYKLAIKLDIKYILSGSNVVTEGVLPNHWTHKKSDYINIKDIHKKHGSVSLKTFPFINKTIKDKIKKRNIETVELLNWIPYNKKDAKDLLQRELNWQDYGGKHYESVFTKFYQAYILPVKFNVDKRKAHLSTLICSGQITKNEALTELKKPLYDPGELKTDKAYVLKKLGFTDQQFEALMKQQPIKHSDFAMEGSLFHYYPVIKPLQPIWNRIKKVRRK